MSPCPISSCTSTLTTPRVTLMRRARSAREMGWCSRRRLSAMRRLISREVVRVATLKSCVLIFLMGCRRAFVRSLDKISPPEPPVKNFFCAPPRRHAAGRNSTSPVRSLFCLSPFAFLLLTSVCCSLDAPRALRPNDSPQGPSAPKVKRMLVALGSARAAKIMALRAACARVAEVDARWRQAELLTRSVETGVARMPLNDTQLMWGARNRAEAVRLLLKAEGKRADFYVGLEGGFHSITFDGERRTC